MNDVLKKCPFCGERRVTPDLWVDLYGFWRVGCGQCGSHSGCSKVKENVIEAWNTRATDEKLAKCVAFIKKIATQDWLDECNGDNAYEDISQLSCMAEKLLEEIDK